MSNSSFSYFFLPDQIKRLPSWRFTLHFLAPVENFEMRWQEAISALRAASFKAISFPAGLDNLRLEAGKGTLDVSIEVTPERRAEPDSAINYESDIWNIYGTMVPYGFCDLVYQSIDSHHESGDADWLEASLPSGIRPALAALLGPTRRDRGSSLR